MAKAKKPRKPKVRTRYSIGEWYGKPFERMTPSERFENAKTELEIDGITGKPCPFRPPGLCNKKGGVCSLRLYIQTDSGPVTGDGHVITTCPSRFEERQLIYRWVGEVLLQTSEPVALGEIGFLDRLRPENEIIEEEDEDNRDFIGRIDSVLVHPTRDPLDWCALELQAVYFSGKSMRNEFKMLGANPFPDMPFPAQHRRPDWRSSGPKRLLPQLQTKIPTIRTWGKKTAVVIDEAFFSSLVGLGKKEHLSNAEIVWFVVGYEESKGAWKLVTRDFYPSTLDVSVKSLTGGVPLPREKFEQQLRLKLAMAAPSHPLALPQR